MEPTRSSNPTPNISNMRCHSARLPCPPGCGRGVLAARGVALLNDVGVSEGVSVGVSEGVRVGVIVGVSVAVLVGVGVAVFVAVGEGVRLGVPVLAAGVCRMRYSLND